MVLLALVPTAMMSKRSTTAIHSKPAAAQASGVDADSPSHIRYDGICRSVAVMTDRTRLDPSNATSTVRWRDSLQNQACKQKRCVSGVI